MDFQFLLALIVVLVILLIFFGIDGLFLFGIGYIFANISGESKILGGYTECTTDHFKKTFDLSESKKYETMVRLMFNCFVKAGIFVEVDHLEWLKEKEGTHLSLDGYNAELNIAFEYQGPGHYKNVYNDSVQDYARQRYNDEQKKIACEKNGTKLIIISYNITNLRNLSLIQDYIKSRLDDVGALKPRLTYTNKKLDIVPEPSVQDIPIITNIQQLFKKNGKIVVYRKKS